MVDLEFNLVRVSNGGGVSVQEVPARRVAIAEHIQETPSTRLRGERRVRGVE